MTCWPWRHRGWLLPMTATASTPSRSAYRLATGIHTPVTSWSGSAFTPR